ncbi:unnamed protein product [Caenorhabditis sp. 36 PRJEB53466]|nr:unnamed protein product [Caenorhabditis sp. 36 PRJEB53466]
MEVDDDDSVPVMPVQPMPTSIVSSQNGRPRETRRSQPPRGREHEAANRSRSRSRSPFPSDSEDDEPAPRREDHSMSAERMLQLAEEEIEARRLAEIIAEQERQAQERHDRREAEERISRAKDDDYRRVRYMIGYHVDAWPPRAVGSRFFVRAINDLVSDDRLFSTYSQIRKFWRRRHYIDEEKNDKVVIVAEDDTVVNQFRELMTVKRKNVVAIKEMDLRTECEAWVNAQLHKYEQGVGNVLVCTLALEKHNLIPFGKLTIFNKVQNNDLFNAFVTRQTKRSRLRKETSVIDVCLSHQDSPAIAENIVQLMHMREEYPDKELMDFFEGHCWRGRPEERVNYENWREMERHHVARENEFTLTKIGPYAEKWWTDPYILEKVTKFVKPTKEFRCHERRPVRMARGCIRNCAEYQAWIRENPMRDMDLRQPTNDRRTVVQFSSITTRWPSAPTPRAVPPPVNTPHPPFHPGHLPNN